MNNFDLAELVLRFLQDARVITIFALVVIDVVTGIAAAIKRGEFSWGKMGDFYRTNVLPYIISYLPVYVVFQYLGMYIGDVLSEGIVTLLWAPIVSNLAASIGDNLKDLGVQE